MAQRIAAILRTLMTALPSSGGTPNNLGLKHPCWGFLGAHEKHAIAAGFRRDWGAPARAAISCYGGLPGGAAGVRKNRGKKTAGVAGRRLRAPGAVVCFAALVGPFGESGALSVPSAEPMAPDATPGATPVACHACHPNPLTEARKLGDACR